ncbi:MAG: NUDIX domain-containing protein [Dactylosporangium sp.]|nr:NUDIX domain-containing protein [Dactylosporangium sp.]NNJ63536.1 NUDIX domain-containing protein [Dactylosporangium sp.]
MTTTTVTVTSASRHHTASAVVIDPTRGLVLLVAHKLTGRHQFPGGHVDPDETGDQCALREVAEETGVTATLWTAPRDRTPIPGAVRHPTPLMVCEFPAPADPDPAWNEPAHHHIDLLYLATADATTPTTIQPDEVDAAIWVPLADLTAPPVRPDVPVAARLACDLLGLAHPGKPTPVDDEPEPQVSAWEVDRRLRPVGRG